MIFNGENSETFPPSIRKETKMPAFSVAFNIVLEVLARAIKKKDIQIGNGVIKLSLFTDDMILYIYSKSQGIH